jgi:hypothetical protein
MGVLALGGIGVLVAQLMTSQSRTWFFGLARVAGATTFDVAAIVIFEVVLLIVLGSLAAVVLAVLLRPAIEAWSAETLGAQLVILDVCCQLSEALRAAEEADQNLGRPAAVEYSHEWPPARRRGWREPENFIRDPDPILAPKSSR